MFFVHAGLRVWRARAQGDVEVSAVDNHRATFATDSSGCSCQLTATVEIARASYRRRIGWGRNFVNAALRCASRLAGRGGGDGAQRVSVCRHRHNEGSEVGLQK